ncbi:hypothetical protein, partial [Fibrobacter sp. UWCM]|uniref:hypothetical protein n=1 Tax=Fibrobacter sp. UWCM TaxID=1896208 RepID=UPI001C31DDB8
CLRFKNKKDRPALHGSDPIIAPFLVLETIYKKNPTAIPSWSIRIFVRIGDFSQYLAKKIDLMQVFFALRPFLY